MDHIELERQGASNPASIRTSYQRYAHLLTPVWQARRDSPQVGKMGVGDAEWGHQRIRKKTGPKIEVREASDAISSKPQSVFDFPLFTRALRLKNFTALGENHTVSILFPPLPNLGVGGTASRVYGKGWRDFNFWPPLLFIGRGWIRALSVPPIANT